MRSRPTKKLLVVFAATVTIALAGLPRAAPRLGADEPTPNPETLKELDRTLQNAAPASGQLGDPAFDKYVDDKLFLQAVSSADSALLTDLALQMAEGERVLMRPHKSVPAAKLFELAMRAALATKDGPSLERLEKGAGGLKNEGLKEKLAGARVLLKGSRAVEPGLLPSADKPLETNLQLQLYRDNIAQAKLYGDADYLTALAKELPDNPHLTGKTNAAMRGQIEDALAGLPKDKDPIVEALQKLSGSSRGATPNPGVLTFANGNSSGAGGALIISGGVVPGFYLVDPPMPYGMNGVVDNTSRYPFYCGNAPGGGPGYFSCQPERTTLNAPAAPSVNFTFGITNMTQKYNVSFSLIAPNGMTVYYFAKPGYKSEFPFAYRGAGSPKIRIYQTNGKYVDYTPTSTWGYYFVLSGSQIVLVTDKNQPVKPN